MDRIIKVFLPDIVKHRYTAEMPVDLIRKDNTVVRCICGDVVFSNKNNNHIPNLIGFYLIIDFDADKFISPSL